jgi:hypothetical protein
MPVLKNEKIDDIEDVTILVMKDISVRHKIVDDRIHLCLAETKKLESDVMVNMSENSDLCWSDKTAHIYVLIDFPTVKTLDQFIKNLQEIREEHFG